MTPLVAVDDAAVGEHHPCGDELVAGQPVLAAEDPQPAAEHEAGDPDRRAAARRDRHAVRIERVIDVAEPCAGADRRHPVADRHAVDRGDVDQHPLGRGAAGEAVPAGAHRQLESAAAGGRDRLGHVGGRRAARDRLRPEVVEEPERRPATASYPSVPGTQDAHAEPSPIGGPSRVTGGISCSAHSGGSTPSLRAARRANSRSNPAGVHTIR